MSAVRNAEHPCPGTFELPRFTSLNIVGLVWDGTAGVLRLADLQVAVQTLQFGTQSRMNFHQNNLPDLGWQTLQYLDQRGKFLMSQALVVAKDVDIGLTG